MVNPVFTIQYHRARCYSICNWNVLKHNVIDADFVIQKTLFWSHPLNKNQWISCHETFCCPWYTTCKSLFIFQFLVQIKSSTLSLTHLAALPFSKIFKNEKTANSASSVKISMSPRLLTCPISLTEVASSSATIFLRSFGALQRPAAEPTQVGYYEMCYHQLDRIRCIHM